MNSMIDIIKSSVYPNVKKYSKASNTTSTEYFISVNGKGKISCWTNVSNTSDINLIVDGETVNINLSSGSGICTFTFEKSIKAILGSRTSTGYTSHYLVQLAD